jgi:hypothetical protein
LRHPDRLAGHSAARVNADRHTDPASRQGKRQLNTGSYFEAIDEHRHKPTSHAGGA